VGTGLENHSKHGQFIYAHTGDTLFVNWNSNRGSKAWDCCALSVIHIPESERK
jgi:hypothetical protein